MKKIAKGVTSGFQKIEDSVVGGYRKIESGVVGAFRDVEDKFVSRFLTRRGNGSYPRFDLCRAPAQARILKNLHQGKNANKTLTILW